LGGRFHVQQLRLAVVAGSVGAVAIVAMATAAYTAPARTGIALLEPITQAVFYRTPAMTSFALVGDHVVLSAGDAVRTDATGRAYITYADGTSLVVEPNSDLVITVSAQDSDLLVLVTQNAGRVWYQISRTLSPSARYEVHSGSLAAVVRAGSTIQVDVTSDGTTVTAVEGTVDTSSGGSTVTVTAGTGTSVASGQPPVALAPTIVTLPSLPSATPQPFVAAPIASLPVATLPLPSIPTVTTPPPLAKPTPTPTPKKHEDPQPSSGKDDAHGHGR